MVQLPSSSSRQRAPAGRPGSRSDTETDDSDHAYFQAVEEIFVELRGAPLLLSPADWQVARRWHQQGIPLDLVRRTLGEVFARRRERGAKGKISSLRYCASAVDAAWSELCQLTAPGHRAAGPGLDVPPRLAALAAALPADLPDRERLASRIASLAGDPEAVEDQLSALDRQMLAAAADGLDPSAGTEIATAVDKTLAALGARLPADELAVSRQRLVRQAVRRRLRLPVLSLFSPEAEPHTDRGD